MEWMFTKRLTQTDVQARLSWPRKHLRVLLYQATMNLNHSSDGNDTNEGSRFQFRVYDVESQCCRALTCTTRKSGNPKPVISGSWTRFIEENGLQENDEITFYRNTDPGTIAERPFSVQVTTRANRS